jgi:hypothetical protein
VRVVAAAEHPVELDVGVDAGRDAAEHLEDRVLLEDDAGVALLGVENPRPGADRELRARFGLEDDVADRATGGDQGQQLAGGAGVVERVVTGAGPVGADRRDLTELDDGPRLPGHDHLVALGAAVGVFHVDQHQVEVVVERRGRRLLDGRQGAGAAGVPPLQRQPFGERQRHCFSSDPHSWNQ